MRLTMSQLRGVVSDSISNERNNDALCAEIKRLLGPSVDVKCSLDEMAERANDRLLVLERTDRRPACDIRPALLLRFANHRSGEVRKLVANLLPEQMLYKMSNDVDPSVRYTVARRVPQKTLNEMIRRHPKDDELASIRNVREAAGYEPSIIDVPQSSSERLGDSVKQSDGPEMSEGFYKSLAFKLIQDYDVRVIESNWIPRVIDQYVKHTRATSLVEIDGMKLRKEIERQLKEREDMHLERDALKETIKWLGSRVAPETAVMPIIAEDCETAHVAYSSTSEAISCISEHYNVRESELPPFIKKFRIGEGRASSTRVPMSARTPHGGAINEHDEATMDTFVSSWNTRQAMVGEPLKLGWHPSPIDPARINFTVELK